MWDNKAETVQEEKKREEERESDEPYNHDGIKITPATAFLLCNTSSVTVW